MGGLVFWNSIHLEVASNPFCLLCNCPWLLVFALCVFFLILSALNLYFWKGIHFSWSLDLIFGGLLSFLFSTFWFRDLLRELDKKYEVLLIIFFLVFLLFLVSEGLLFVSFFWTSFHSSSSPSLGIWPGEGFYVPDPCELTFANTLLLSNAAISLGNAFISLEISSSFLPFFSLFSFIFNINKKRSPKNAELVLTCNNGGLPRYVLNQLKIFVPVGKDIKIVTPVK